jgi:hypothetical protein
MAKGYPQLLSKWRIPLSVFFIILTVSSLSIGKYGYSDDYSNLWNAKYGTFDLLMLCTSQGRPLLGIISIAVFFPINDIDSLLYLHILSRLCLALLGVLIYRILYFANENHKRFNSFTILWLSALPLVVNSGFLFFGAWATTFPALLGLLVGCFGVLKVLRDSKSFSGGLFIAVNILIYQPNFILLLLIFLMAHLLLNSKSGHSEFSSIILSHKLLVLLFLINTLLSLVSIQASKFLGFSSGARSTITSEYALKVEWFLGTVIPRIVNFYSPWEPNPFSIIPLTILFVIGMTLLYKRFHSKSKFLTILLMSGPISIAPNILISENWASARSLLAPQWFFSTLVLLPIVFILSKSLANNFFRFLASMLILSITLFNYHGISVVNFKEPQEIELKIARQYLTADVCKNLKSVTQSSWTDSLANKVSYDEFGIPSTTQPWVPIPLTKLICLENGIKVGPLTLIPQGETRNHEGNVNFAKLIQDYKELHHRNGYP